MEAERWYRRGRRSDERRSLAARRGRGWQRLEPGDENAGIRVKELGCGQEITTAAKKSIGGGGWLGKLADFSC